MTLVSRDTVRVGELWRQAIESETVPSALLLEVLKAYTDLKDQVGSPSPSTLEDGDPEVWVVLRGIDVIYAETAGERPAPDIPRDARLVRYVPKNVMANEVSTLNMRAQAADQAMRALGKTRAEAEQAAYAFAITKVREILELAKQQAGRDVARIAESKGFSVQAHGAGAREAGLCFYNDMRERLDKLSPDLATKAYEPPWGVWWCEEYLADYGHAMPIGGSWLVRRDTNQTISLSKAAAEDLAIRRTASHQPSRFEARLLPPEPAPKD